MGEEARQGGKIKEGRLKEKKKKERNVRTWETLNAERTSADLHVRVETMPRLGRGEGFEKLESGVRRKRMVKKEGEER